MKKILITFGIVTPVAALAFAAAPVVLLNILYGDIGCERCRALRADFRSGHTGRNQREYGISHFERIELNNGMDCWFYYRCNCGLNRNGRRQFYRARTGAHRSAHG